MSPNVQLPLEQHMRCEQQHQAAGGQLTVCQLSYLVLKPQVLGVGRRPLSKMAAFTTYTVWVPCCHNRAALLACCRAARCTALLRVVLPGVLHCCV
jgi:hypothetical protein